MQAVIHQLRKNRLEAYAASPGDIREHFGIEQVVLAGGYGYRQVMELIQNGADAILEAHEAGMLEGGQSRIEVLDRPATRTRRRYVHGDLLPQLPETDAAVR